MATITITHTHSWSNAVCLHCRSVCQPQYFLFVHVVSSSLSPETHQKHTEITDKKQNSKPYEFWPAKKQHSYVRRTGMPFVPGRSSHSISIERSANDSESSKQSKNVATREANQKRESNAIQTQSHTHTERETDR